MTGALARARILAIVVIPLVLGACTSASEPPSSSVDASAPGSTPPLASSQARSRPAGRRVNVPASIDATGKRDVSGEIQAFIDGVPNGVRVVFRAGGTYRLNEALRIAGRRNLTLDGNGAQLNLRGDSGKVDSAGIIVWDGSSGTTIRGFTMVGDNREAGTSAACCAREGQHGIAVLSATDTLIKDVDIRRVWGDCLYVSHQFDRPAWSDGVTFRDSSCTLTGRNGVAIIAARNVRIEKNRFDDVGHIVVDIEPNTGDGGASGVVMHDNSVGSYGLTDSWVSQLFAACGATGSTVKDVTVSTNAVEGNKAGYDGRVLGLNVRVCGDRGLRQGIAVIDNRALSTVAGPVVIITDADQVTVTGNSQPLSSGELAELSGSSGVVYEGNDG